jgi:tellurite resistance protein
MSEERIDAVKGHLAQCGGFCDTLASEQERLAAEEATAEESTLHAAMIEASYLIGLADGEMSQAEADAMTEGMYALTNISQENVQTLLQVAGARVENEGKEARTSAIGQDITDPDLRRGTFLVAAAVSWKDGGIGVKQGLALQALARAFEIPMNEMHKLLAKAHG